MRNRFHVVSNFMLPPYSELALFKLSAGAVGRWLPTARFGLVVKLSGPLIRVISTPSLRFTDADFRLNFGSLML